MGRKANDHELSLGETRRETILNPLNAAKSDDEAHPSTVGSVRRCWQASKNDERQLMISLFVV
jgi:hypothetical protein